MPRNYDAYRKIARETIDPEARVAIISLIEIAEKAEDEVDAISERVGRLYDHMLTEFSRVIGDGERG
jgi:hypothetical protein